MNINVTTLPSKTSIHTPTLFDPASTLIRMREVETIVGMKRSTI